MNDKIKTHMLAYALDLSYWLEEGLDSLNFVTAGTPYFESEEEAEEYITNLYNTANKMEIEK